MSATVADMVAGTLRVPSASLFTAHGVCLLLCTQYSNDEARLLAKPGFFRHTPNQDVQGTINSSVAGAMLQFGAESVTLAGPLFASLGARTGP